MAARLSRDERALIEAHMRAGAKPEEVAGLIGRAPSTVYRELGRCGGAGSCSAERAQQHAEGLARRPRVCKLEARPALAGQVKRRLELCWSPHAISADLADGGERVCAETIYRAAYSGCALGPEAWKNLPRRQRCRKPRSRAGAETASPLGDYRPVSERPAEAQNRSEAGHWEGDLIVGANNKSAAATLVERVSRHTLVVPLPDGYRAPQVAAAVTAAPARQPAHMVRTLTWDQGRETARWADIETALAIKVFFCDARSPRQRPTNEHTNGLLRRRLPKSTRLDLSPLRLSITDDNPDWKPRKPHNWQSAAHIYTQPTRNHQ